jgi:hypothetical protein
MIEGTGARPTDEISGFTSREGLLARLRANDTGKIPPLKRKFERPNPCSPMAEGSKFVLHLELGYAPNPNVGVRRPHENSLKTSRPGETFGAS